MSEFDEIRQRAEAGDPVAQNRLGVMYGVGTGVIQDYSESLRWLNKSANQGNDAAKQNLNYRFYDSQRGTKSFEDSVKRQRGY